jgi:hypothetical protein
VHTAPAVGFSPSATGAKEGQVTGFLPVGRAFGIAYTATCMRLHITNHANRPPVRISHQPQLCFMQDQMQSPTLLKCTAHRLPARIGFTDCSGCAIDQYSPIDPGFAYKPRMGRQVETRQLINERWRQGSQRWVQRRAPARTPRGDSIQQLAVHPVSQPNP